MGAAQGAPQTTCGQQCGNRIHLGSRNVPDATTAGQVVDTSALRFAIVGGMVAFIAVLAVAAFWNIGLLPMVMAAGILLCVGVLAIRFTVAVSALWLLVAGTTPEMWLADLYPGNENTITALVKLTGLALLAVCILRYGWRTDIFNPGWAFVFMFMTGLAHGLWPTLTVSDSLRSLIGGFAPFAFSFSRLSRPWCRAIIQATIWVAPVIVGLGVPLALAGVRPLLTDADGVLRLEGSTHPAFLAGFAMAGVYAALIELYRDGRNINLASVALNFVILLATGARAPLLCTVLVTSIAFVALRSDAFGISRRVLPILLGALLLPLMAALATGSSSLRLLNVLSSEAGDLSGRDVIWPYFEDAWDASPWFGWGVGAGKVVVDPDSLTAHLLGTTAAHDEYLRIGVDGGYIGLALLILLMALWVTFRTRHAVSTDKWIMRMVFLAFALHSVTDNTLIAATASILFAWASAVFARSELERQDTSIETVRPPTRGLGRGRRPALSY